VLPITCGSSS
jgi:hypothetical protein